MTSPRAGRSHEEAARVLRRAGYSDEFIHEVLNQLPDPIDLQRDQQILARYGLTPARLMDRSGSSPRATALHAVPRQEATRLVLRQSMSGYDQMGLVVDRRTQVSRPSPGACRMDLGLRDRVYLVTGGSRGLGFAAAEALVADGARIVLSSPREATAEAAAARLGQNAAASGAVTWVAADNGDPGHPGPADRVCPGPVFAGLTVR